MRKRKAIFEEFIKNYLYKVESVLKIQLKIARITSNEENNEIVWEWFTNARSKSIHISGPMVQSAALTVAKSLGNDQFKEITGWLDSFKNRHNIVWNGVCGESKNVDEIVASVYKPKLISPYEPKHIYNVDETGLFSRALLTKSLAVKGEKYRGQNVQRKSYSVIVWEYGGRNGKASCDWKSSKTKMFQELG
jgi:hypothetical protein